MLPGHWLVRICQFARLVNVMLSRERTIQTESRAYILHLCQIMSLQTRKLDHSISNINTVRYWGVELFVIC